MRLYPDNLRKPSPMTAVTASDVAARVSAALHRSFDNRRHAAKTIAATVQASPRAVEAWLQGESAPRAAELIRLCAAFDEVFEVVCLLAERKPEALPLSRSQREALVDILKTLEDA